MIQSLHKNKNKNVGRRKNKVLQSILGDEENEPNDEEVENADDYNEEDLVNNYNDDNFQRLLNEMNTPNTATFSSVSKTSDNNDDTSFSFAKPEAKGIKRKLATTNVSLPNNNTKIGLPSNNSKNTASLHNNDINNKR
jgi:hypothetical protein